MRFLIKFLVFALAVYLAAWIVPGIELAGLKNTLLVTLVMGLLNTFIKPVVKLLALPVTILTIGLFAFVINAAFIMLVGRILPDSFIVAGFIPALIYSVVLTVIHWVLNLVFETGK